MIARAFAVPLFRSLATLTMTSVVLAACGGGGGGSVAPVAMATPTPTPMPTSTSANPVGPNAATAFTCPSSDATSNAVASAGATAGVDAVGRANGLRVARPASSTPGLLAVTYTNAAASSAAVTTREQAAGATVLQTLALSYTGKVVHVLSVPAARMTTVAATLRAQAGVESVAPTGAQRFPTAVSTPFFTSDPYFNGFTAAQNASAGNSSAPTTFQIPPYEEASSVAGQWDMHAIQLEHAFAYSQPSNGSAVSNPNALGTSSVKIAIIDTGEDSTHPELASKIVYQRCFITNAAGTKQSTSTFETDPAGHGTDVAGIAADDTNNAFGFAGSGGNAVIYGYRVFPTPDDNCINENTTDQQCGANTTDIASAITDAVAQGVNVISMSLGGDSCGTGATFAANGDPDITEGNAVANAIAHNVIVVAAAGNSGAGNVTAPACDAGVIAVGASALGDGTLNGSNTTVGTAAAPVEYVASYSQYGSANVPQSASAWGIVAPGGDPSSSGTTTVSSSDSDDLHWIENIWTSTPYASSSADNDFRGTCTDNYATTAGPVDCRTLIAGTSMSTPHVAGAAALILAVNASYQSPSAMKQLLCSTADSIGGNQGCGRLNVYRAMAHALNDPAPP